MNIQSDQPRTTKPLPDQRVAARARAQEAWQRLILHVLSVTPRMLVRFLLVVAALSAVGWLFWTGRSGLFWFFIGAVLAYLFLPLVNLLERWLPRWAAIILVYVAAVVLLVGVVLLIVPPLLKQIGEAIHGLPDSKAVNKWLQDMHAYITTLPPHTQDFINNAIKQLTQTIESNIVTYIENIATFVLDFVSNLFNLVSFLFGFIIVPIWVFYVLRDQRKGMRSIDRKLPPWLRADFWAVLRIVDQVFGSWIRGQLFLSTVLAVEIWVGLNLLRLLGFQGIQYTLLLAFIAFITSPIPYIANYLAIIPALFMGLQNSIETTLAIVVVYVISQNVQDNLLGPKINGAALNVHPAILMPLLILLGRFGLIWVILSGPIAATCRDLFMYVYGRFDDPPRPAGLLPRAQPPAAEAERAQAPPDQTTPAPAAQESPDPTNLPEDTPVTP